MTESRDGRHTAISHQSEHADEEEQYGAEDAQDIGLRYTQRGDVDRTQTDQDDEEPTAVKASGERDPERVHHPAVLPGEVQDQLLAHDREHKRGQE